MSYRLTDPNPVWVGLLGTASAGDGTLQFYDQGTTTPKATYSDEELTTPNANPVELDAAGRAETEIWLDGAYTVVLKDEDGTTVWTRDVVPEVSPTTTLPDPTTLPGGTIQSNGTGYELVEVMALPDPTDSAGYMVVVNSDGTGYGVQPIPEPEDPVTSVNTNYVTFGMDTGDKWMIQKGSDTAPSAPASQQTSKAVTFSPAFKSGTTPYVSITPAPGTQPSGPIVVRLASPPTATGFTAEFDVAEGNSSGQYIANSVFFLWKAEGVFDG